jgi:hypothetical protein
MDNRKRRAGLTIKTALFLASLALLMVSCASPDAGRDATLASATQRDLYPQGYPTPAETEPGRPYPSVPEGIERVPTNGIAPVTGEVPADLLQDVLEDLSSRQKVDIQEIDVLKGEYILWPDGSLGCSQPGEYYTQAAVPGYWIILQLGTAAYDYRASETGHFILCEQPLPIVPTSP